MADASHLRVVVVNFWFYELNVLVNWRAEFGFARSTPHRTFEYGSPLKIENHCARLTNDICTRTPARALSEERSNQDLRTITESAYETLARQIKRELNLGAHEHCAIYEHELQRLWPLNLKVREAKIARLRKNTDFAFGFIARAVRDIRRARRMTPHTVMKSGQVRFIAGFDLISKPPSSGRPYLTFPSGY